MKARYYDDAAEFWTVAHDLFEAEPAKHTTVLSVVHAVLNAPRPDAAPLVLVTLHDESGSLRGAALRTPPWPLALSGIGVDDVPFLVGELLEQHPGLDSVMGPRDVADRFGGEWASATGTTVKTIFDLRLYRLAELITPQVAGRARIAGEADLDVAVQHWVGFSDESAAHRGTNSADAEAAVRQQFSLGSATVLWEVDGVVVSSAVAKVPNAGASRIGPVYTPPEHRRHGYAAAATAEAARWARSVGAREVLLYTDLANPTSNGVYQRIGFRPVTDFVELAFDAPA
ncbi:GNAT family N-acetyltransferase [Kutzneria buriramensis]|uniref:Putative GNAT family acetyltransferase n=1 Tax=Kutzneria buriramensis TaxID=1045776 RepID=A0A3E0H1C0_9PSEU|nr:GNAT family N-acetyltransferase [Kutzneria buriramensis]REH35849.1 putative GNAT family acetyltransferase [Kutzneria buriramensis]